VGRNILQTLSILQAHLRQARKRYAKVGKKYLVLCQCSLTISDISYNQLIKCKLLIILKRIFLNL
jgi:hypothetical protein